MSLVAAIFDIVRNLIVRLLALYFRFVPIPPSLQTSEKDLDTLCVITESESFILEALLTSFAHRMNKKIVHYSKNEASNSSNTIRWTALHNNPALDKILKADNPPLLATLNIFSGRGPFKAHPAYRLGFWELMGILLLGKFLIIFLGKPFSISTLNINTVTNLRRIIRIDFYKNLKQVRGTPFQSIQAQEKIILGGNEYQAEITQLSDRLSMPRNVLIRKARHAFYEIAANPRRPMYRILAFCVNFINKRLFSSIHSLGLDNLKTSVREETVVLVPMHRSHLDYMLIGSELYHAHFIPPLVAAGINLSFWPAGFLIRSVGAYFVKRNVGSDRLHALMLKRYVSYLVKRGHMQEFFIEGGRSRSGRMRQPKVGLLSIFVDAFNKGYKDDIAFVPVSITYENVIEDSVYGQENTGRAKTKESLLGLFRAGSIFRKRYGDVVINFGEAISLKNYLQNGKLSASESSRISVSNFALHLTRKIREQTNPSLTSLFHTALLISPGYGLGKQELITVTQNLGKLMDASRESAPGIGSNTPALKSFLDGQHHLIDNLSVSSTVKTQFCLGKEVYYIPGERRFTADFYKNSTLHLFFEHGLFAMLDLMKLDISRENIEKFYVVFASDFILKEKQAFLDDCDKLIAALKKRGILKTEANLTTYTARNLGIYNPTMLLPNIESLTWCLKVLSGLTKKIDNLELEEEPESRISVDYDIAMNSMLNEFRTATYLGVTQCTEASSSVSLNAALDTLQNLGLIFVGNKQSKGKKIVVKDLKSPKLDIIRNAHQALKAWKNTLLDEA